MKGGRRGDKEGSKEARKEGRIMVGVVVILHLL